MLGRWQGKGEERRGGSVDGLSQTPRRLWEDALTSGEGTYLPPGIFKIRTEDAKSHEANLSPETANLEDL